MANFWFCTRVKLSLHGIALEKASIILTTQPANPYALSQMQVSELGRHISRYYSGIPEILHGFKTFETSEIVHGTVYKVYISDFPGAS